MSGDKAAGGAPKTFGRRNGTTGGGGLFGKAARGFDIAEDEDDDNPFGCPAKKESSYSRASNSSRGLRTHDQNVQQAPAAVDAANKPIIKRKHKDEEGKDPKKKKEARADGQLSASSPSTIAEGASNVFGATTR